MTVPEMPAYPSHKTVWALKIAQIIVVGDDGTTDENLIVDIVFEDNRFPTQRVCLAGKPKPSVGWYFVKYDDDYISFSPADKFEAGNTLVVPLPVPADLPDRTSFSPDDMQNWFSYHAPTRDQLVIYNEIRTAGFAFAAVVNRHVPAGADKTAAIRKIREAVMACNAAVACATVSTELPSSGPTGRP